MKRVLLIKNDDLITGGIASLLHQVDDINLLNKSIKDMTQLINEIKDLHPSTLILNQDLGYATSPIVFNMLSKYPDLRILVIDDFKNIIHVYERKEVQVTYGEDLIGLIKKE